MDGLRMTREEDCARNKVIGILRNGKRFRSNKKRTMDEREGQKNEKNERDTGVIL
jgi:hypothetical protein